MTAFLRAIDNKTWKAIVKGWSPPVKTPTEESSTAVKSTLKEEADWSKEDDEEALANSKALNAIFNGVDENMFRLINTCIVAKKHGIYSKLLMMKGLQELGCLDFRCSLHNLRSQSSGVRLHDDGQKINRNGG